MKRRRKRVQSLATRPLRIGVAQRPSIAIQKHAASRPRPGRSEFGRKPVPFTHSSTGFVARQDLQIFRFPDIQPRPQRVQEVRNTPRRPRPTCAAPRPGPLASPMGAPAGVRPCSRVCRIRAVRRHVPAQRHLHGQAAAGGEVAHQTREQLAVTVDPLQGGVAVDQVGRLGRGPIPDVGVQPVHRRRLTGGTRPAFPGIGRGRARPLWATAVTSGG